MFTNTIGNGKRDPNLYDEDFIASFFEELGESFLLSMQAAMAQTGGGYDGGCGAYGGGGGMGEEPAFKRQKF